MQISTIMADEVLLSSPRCGLYNGTSNSTAFYTDILAYSSKLTTASVSYVQQCYGDNTSVKAPECSTFIAKRIPQIVTRGINCPFPGNDEICIHTSDGLRIDTGLISSHDHFGINAPVADRFSYRNILECAPLRVNKYKQTRAWASDNTTSNPMVRLLYGAIEDKYNDSITFEWPLHPTAGLMEYSIRSASSCV